MWGGSLKSLILFLCFLCGSAGAQAAIYSLDGVHSKYGSYLGELELRPGEDGQVQVIRVVTYQNFRFEGFRVQEVWKGSGILQGNFLSAVFEIKQADLFNQVDDLKRTREQFVEPVKLVYQMDLNQGTAQLNLPNGNLQEHTVGLAQAAGPEPLWRDERLALPSQGSSFPLIGEIALWTLLRPIVVAYENDPFVAGYRERPEYKSKMQYYILDATDYHFLQSHPDTVRVDNKITDTISLVEASLRRDAYGPALAEKAEGFDQEFVHDHMNELGLYEAAALDVNGAPAGFADNGDAGLWSGMYAGAQAMRYLASKNPEAMIAFKRVLKGMMMMMDVTGDPTEFARTVRPMGDGKLGSNWRQASPPFATLKYVPGGNNDMIKGIYHAFAWAYEILPASDPLLAEVSAHAIKLTDLKIAKEWNHPNNLFLAVGLRALATHDAAWKLRFMTIYGTILKTTGTLGLDIGFYYGGIADWSGINLGMVGHVTNILVANQVARMFGADQAQRAMVQNLRSELMEMWKTYAGSRRDFLTVAAYAFAERQDVLAYPAGIVAVPPPSPELWRTDLRDSVWALREIPVQRSFHAITYDFSWRPDWSISAWPKMPWKYLRDEKEMTFFYQGAYNFPIFECEALQSDNYWTGAFSFKGGNRKQIREGRVDYLYVYWMARFAKLLGDET